jgi:hypothetical protein
MNRRQLFSALAALPFIGKMVPTVEAKSATFTLLGDFVPQETFAPVIRHGHARRPQGVHALGTHGEYACLNFPEGA